MTPVAWENVAVIFEYKKKREKRDWHDVSPAVSRVPAPSDIRDLFQNARKILWNLAFMMYHDPRRRFAFGFTIESLTLRMWYCDRSGFLVSDMADLGNDVSRCWYRSFDPTQSFHYSKSRWSRSSQPCRAPVAVN